MSVVILNDVITSVTPGVYFTFSHPESLRGAIISCLPASAPLHCPCNPHKTQIPAAEWKVNVLNKALILQPDKILHILTLTLT